MSDFHTMLVGSDPKVTWAAVIELLRSLDGVDLFDVLWVSHWLTVMATFLAVGLGFFFFGLRRGPGLRPEVPSSFVPRRVLRIGAALSFLLLGVSIWKIPLSLSVVMMPSVFAVGVWVTGAVISFALTVLLRAAEMAALSLGDRIHYPSRLLGAAILGRASVMGAFQRKGVRGGWAFLREDPRRITAVGLSLPVFLFALVAFGVSVAVLAMMPFLAAPVIVYRREVAWWYARQRKRKMTKAIVEVRKLGLGSSFSRLNPAVQVVVMRARETPGG